MAAAVACVRVPWRPSTALAFCLPNPLHLPASRLPSPFLRRPLLTCCSSQVTKGLASTVCFISLAALALSDPREAFAVAEVGEAATGFSAVSPEVMYSIFAIEAVALIGAAVGGILARRRKVELERLNAQLRKINEYLRSKAMIETYAPGLVYAPVGRPVDDIALETEKEELIQYLKAGKKFLKERKPDLAYEEFQKALPLAQQIGGSIEEVQALRGLGASCQRQGKFQDAIKHHSMVLDISERMGSTFGNTEALGSIADCYCELGDLDAAQKYYNQYIDRLATDEG